MNSNNSYPRIVSLAHHPAQAWLLKLTVYTRAVFKSISGRHQAGGRAGTDFTVNPLVWRGNYCCVPFEISITRSRLDDKTCSAEVNSWKAIVYLREVDVSISYTLSLTLHVRPHNWEEGKIGEGLGSKALSWSERIYIWSFNTRAQFLYSTTVTMPSQRRHFNSVVLEFYEFNYTALYYKYLYGIIQTN